MPRATDQEPGLKVFEPGMSVTVKDHESGYHGQPGIVLYRRCDGRYMVEFKSLKKTAPVEPGVLVSSKDFKC